MKKFTDNGPDYLCSKCGRNTLNEIGHICDKEDEDSEEEDEEELFLEEEEEE